jgi:MOSC domain-containing protein YiiM
VTATHRHSQLPTLAAELVSLRRGKVEPLGPEGTPSAIGKLPVSGRVAITRLGVAGDVQADTSHHGGPDKALHVYPSEHYAEWRRELPERADVFDIGAFGENLATRGLNEATVCLGDILTLGSALIQVSQGRQPCAKLNLRFEQTDMVARVMRSGRGGWYCRVLETGQAEVDDCLTLIERPQPDWPLTRLWRVLFDASVDRQGLGELAGLTLLSEHWRLRAAQRLETASVP